MIDASGQMTSTPRVSQVEECLNRQAEIIEALESAVNRLVDAMAPVLRQPELREKEEREVDPCIVQLAESIKVRNGNLEKLTDYIKDVFSRLEL